MLKVTRTCFYSNGGTNYNVLPAIVVTPLLGVVKCFKPTPAAEFATPPLALKSYPKVGVRLCIKWGTYHAGINIQLSSWSIK